MTHVAFTCLSILGQHVLEINITVPAEIVNISSFLLCLYINVLTSCIDMARRQTPLPADLASRPFAGRLGGNQEFILDPKNVENIAALKRVPYASPFIFLSGIFTPRGFLEPQLWKAAVTEGMGALLLVWSTGFIACHSSTAPPPVLSATSGVYSTPIFLGPLTGGVTNMIILPLFIYSLGPVSGSHSPP